MGTALLTIILAFIATSGINIGQSIQKLGVTTISSRRRRGMLIWALGLLLIVAANIVLVYASKIGRVAIIGGMAGTGLASAAIFSVFVLKESVSKREIIGIVAIIGAAVLIGGFAREYTIRTIRLHRLYLFCGIIIAVYTAVVIIMRKRKGEGVVIGAFAGALAGFVPLFQKVSSTDIGRALLFFDESRFPPVISNFLALYANPYALVWICVSFVSFTVMQFAYRRGKAINIIPAFSSNWILVPVLGGISCFGETLHFPQWFGIAVILGGVYLLSFTPAGKGEIREGLDEPESE